MSLFPALLAPQPEEEEGGGEAEVAQEEEALVAGERVFVAVPVEEVRDAEWTGSGMGFYEGDASLVSQRALVWMSSECIEKCVGGCSARPLA